MKNQQSHRARTASTPLRHRRTGPFYPPPLLTFSNTTAFLCRCFGWLLLAGLLLGTAACSDDDPDYPNPPVVVPDPDPTPEPEPEPEPEPQPEADPARTLHLTADWAEALAAADVPAAYVLRIGDGLLSAPAGGTLTYRDSLADASLAIWAYNEPEDITVQGTTATIGRTADGTLTALPGYLFAADSTVAVAPGDTATVALPMRRLLVPLSLTIGFSHPVEVVSASATMGGLVEAISLPHGTPLPPVARAETRTRLACEVQTGNTGLVLRLRTFGIHEDARQTLTLSLVLADGRTLQLADDLSDALRPFGLKEPVALKSQINTAPPTPEPEPEPEPEPDVPIDVSGTLQPWEPVKGGHVEAT